MDCDTDARCWLQIIGYGPTNATNHSDQARNATIVNENHHMVSPESNEIGKHIYAYAAPFIIVIGLVGNVLSLCVFTSRQLRKLSASLYLVAISASDTIVLLSYVLLDWLARHLRHWPGSPSIDVINVDGICQTFLFISYTFRFISVYLIVVFTIERFIAVCRPLHRRRICTKSFAHRIILTVHLLGATLSITKPLISGVVVNGPATGDVNISTGDVNVTMPHMASALTSSVHTIDFEGEEVLVPTNKICTRLDDFKDVNTVLELIYGLCITIVPFLIITILNVLILRKLLRGDNLNNNSMAKKATFVPRNRIRIELTITLMGISSAFIILNLPYFIVWLKLYLPDDDLTRTNERTRNYLYIAKTVFIINYSINFFVYCMTGTYYRGVIKRILSCLKESNPYQAAMPSDTTMKTELKEMPSRSSNGIRLTPPSDLPSLADTYNTKV